MALSAARLKRSGSRLQASHSRRAAPDDAKFLARRTRRQQAEQRRIQLLDTALEVFAAHGFDGTSVKDLAEAAGVTQGLLYHYFASRRRCSRRRSSATTSCLSCGASPPQIGTDPRPTSCSSWP